MKHISSKLILVMVILVAALISFVSFFSIRMLTKETRAHTFQNQQLQTQALARTFELEASKAEEAASRVFNIKNAMRTPNDGLTQILAETQTDSPNVKAIGIYFKQTREWLETTPGSFSSFDAGIFDRSEPVIIQDVKTSEHILSFPATNAIVAVRELFERSKVGCSGLPVGLFNRLGDPILLCNHEASEWPKTSKDALERLLSSPFNSGAIEISNGDHSGLWGYARLSIWGKLITFTDQQSTYHASYLLTIRILLFAIFSIGVALIASILAARKIADPIKAVSEATQKIADGEFDTPIEIETKDETLNLANSVLAMAQKMKNLIRTEIDKAKLDAQLEVAGVVQRTLIPASYINFGKFQITSLYQPADECGGDWWGYVKAKDHLVIFIGDVTGHGYPSALLVATTRGFISMVQDNIDKNEGVISFTGPECLRTLNRVVHDAAKGELNMTAMCVILNVETGAFQISSAGHNNAYQLVPEGNEARILSAEGERLGEVQVYNKELTVVEGVLASKEEKLVLFTDGIQDLGPNEDDLVGRKGFRKFLVKKVKANGLDIVKSAGSDLLTLNDGRPLADDVTLVVIDQGSAQKKAGKSTEQTKVATAS